MKTTQLKLSLLAALAAIPGIVSAAPIPVTGTMVHSENFDSLTAASVAWTNDSTISGWYAQINNGTTATGSAQAADGVTVLSGLLNCGAAADAERALGSKATGTGAFANIAYAVSFQNTTASPVQLSKVNYTGELWRTNTTAAGLAETFTVFYQVSPAAITNIISGPGAAVAAAGTGFTALGAGANWASPTNLPAGSALDGNLAANRTAVSFTPASSIVIQPGQFLMIKWTDTNLGGTDGFQAIDDASFEFTALSGSVAIAASARTRSDAGTPANNLDDTFGFTASITGSGSVTTWGTSDVQPPVTNAAAGPYGTPVVWSGFPIAPKTVTITDSGNPAFSAAVTVDPLLIIGSNNLVTADTPILQEDAPLVGWTIDDAARTLTQTAATGQTDKIVNSAIIDLSATGFVQFSAELDAITGASSGFELADGFGLQLIIDGGAPISVLGAADVDGNGRLNGAAAAGGLELPDTTLVSTTKPFAFSYIIPDTANTVQIRIIGYSNSTNETFLVKNVKLGSPPPTIVARTVGPSALDNKGTVNPADDEFSGAVNVFGVNLVAGSDAWDSDSTPATGLYATPLNNFGPYLVSGGAKLVTFFDRTTPALTTSVTVPLPPAPTLTATAPMNILRLENGPGTADDSVTFDVTLTSTNGGPSWTASGATPGAGAFGPVTFTIPAPLPATPATITVADVSYPTVTAAISVAIPGRYTIGQRNLGAGLQDVLSDLTTVPAPQWVNDAAARTLTMTAGIAADSVVTSDVINLSGAGIVYFTANFSASEISGTSNFETTDRFKAELLIDGGLVPANIINLVSSYDTGDGAPAVGAAGGPNGPPNGYINGYQGIAVAPATGPDDYNANSDRDEFNRPIGNPLARLLAADSIGIAPNPPNNFPLSYTIPAEANSVQLKIYGTGAAGSETFIVSNVLFSTTPSSSDTDGDGISNTDEAIMGTDPNNASDALRLSQNAGNPNQLDFPTKAGRFYHVYQSDDTNGQEGTHLLVWKDAGVATIVGDGNPASFSITVTPGEPRRFYRLDVMTTNGPLGDGVWPATRP